MAVGHPHEPLGAQHRLDGAVPLLWLLVSDRRVAGHRQPPQHQVAQPAAPQVALGLCKLAAGACSNIGTQARPCWSAVSLAAQRPGGRLWCLIMQPAQHKCRATCSSTGSCSLASGKLRCGCRASQPCIQHLLQADHPIIRCEAGKPQAGVPLGTQRSGAAACSRGLLVRPPLGVEGRPT